MLMRVQLVFTKTNPPIHPPPPLLFFQYYFTISFTHENQKALELRTEDVKDCDEWVAAISHARCARCGRGFLQNNEPRPGFVANVTE